MRRLVVNFVFLCFLSVGCGAYAQDITVNPGDDIAAKLKEASAGATVTFSKGEHKLPKAKVSLTLSGVTVKGEEGAILTADASGDKKSKGDLIVFGENYSFVNLTFKGISGFSLSGKNISFENCYFTGGPTLIATNDVKFNKCVFTTGGTAITVKKSINGLTVNYCTFKNCERGGISANRGVNPCSNLIVSNCTFLGTPGRYGGCISVASAAEIVVFNNIFADVNGGAALELGKDCKSIQFLHNTIFSGWRMGGTPKAIEGKKSGNISDLVVKNNIISVAGSAYSFTKEQLDDKCLFSNNVYVGSSGNVIKEWGIEKGGIYNTAAGFKRSPADISKGIDLRVRKGFPASKGAPLLAEVKIDMNGKPRSEGGAYGAIAELADGGCVYYMSPEGDDKNDGTKEKPFATPSAACGVLNAGDTLILLPGRYQILCGNENKNKWKFSGISGTKEFPVIVKGEGKVVINGNWNNPLYPKDAPQGGNAGISVHKNKFLTFEKFELSHSSGFGVAWSEGITFRDLHIFDYHNYGIISADTHNILVENVTIHGSKYEHAIYFTANNQDVIVRNSEFYDTAINGLHINSTNNCRFLIENNKFHHLSREWGACITLMGAHDITIRNNLFYCNMGHVFTPTFKGKGGKGGRAHNITVVGNTFYQPVNGRKGAMILPATAMQGWIVKNNIIATNTSAIAADKVQESSVIENNIFGPMTNGKSLEAVPTVKNNKFDAKIEFIKLPKLNDMNYECDLRLKSGSDGATGAPLLKDLCPEDFEHKSRKDGGAYGAYANAAN